MGVTISQNDVLQKGHSCVTITLPDWLHLDLFGELVHHHQHMSHVTSGWLELSHHIQTPNCKGQVIGIVFSAEAGRWIFLANL